MSAKCFCVLSKIKRTRCWYEIVRGYLSFDKLQHASLCLIRELRETCNNTRTSCRAHQEVAKACLYIGAYIVHQHWHSLKSGSDSGLDSGPWILDSGFWTLDSGFWTLDSGLWILDSGLWTLDSGLWTLDSGLWILDSGLWTLDSELWTLNSGLWNLDSLS